jgi:hypothetical protein
MEAENKGQGAEAATKLVTDAGFQIAGTPYEAFIRTYFAG